MVMRLTRVHGLLVSCTKPSSVLERVSDGMYVLISQSLLYTSLPSAKIDRSKLSYISADQQQELLEILYTSSRSVLLKHQVFVHTSNHRRRNGLKSGTAHPPTLLALPLRKRFYG
jgi:hypothetical protein